jgi:aryl-alcohol dehydrogenase-like predicted oxidoreductase
VALPYYGLARGFLTGKYRDDGPDIDGPRAAGARCYLDDRGRRVLAVLDRISAERGTTTAAVALAWLAARPGVAAPIASARSTTQLDDLLAVKQLTPGAPSALTVDEIAELDATSATQ